jgi:PAS domain S-box-containing protein
MLRISDSGQKEGRLKQADDAEDAGMQADQPDADGWFRSVVEAAPNAMILIDRERRIVLVNHAAEKLFGYGRQELMGQAVELLVPERAAAAHPARVDAFHARPSARAMGAGRDLHGHRKDGTEVPIEIGLNPLLTADGQWTLASIIDISARQRAEAAHERLAAIVESSDDAIISMSLEGTVTSWNRGAEQLFGYSPDEAVGASMQMLIPGRLPESECTVRRQVHGDTRVNHFETVRLRKDGSEVDVSVRQSPIRNSAGVVMGESSIMRDITESKQRSVELQRSNAELEQFAYVASHDLQEPLRMMANYTELLARRYQGQLDEKADKYIHYASDGARRMQRLVSDLLAFSRVGSQGRPLAPTSSQRVLKDVIHSLKPLVRAAGATVAFEALPMVMADESQLHQLFQNLLSNAIKFRSEAPPHIVVSAVAEGSWWSFSVADNGIGLEMRFAERIFQMFQRLHALGRYEGGGIGLAIAKRIVERHGGRIWVESAPGTGTTFHFTLASEAKGKT